MPLQNYKIFWKQQPSMSLLFDWDGVVFDKKKNKHFSAFAAPKFGFLLGLHYLCKE